ncbi:MAG: DUF2497 domain-containing protein [Alphaproteobacteria bacterium]|nr:DUF2497 domain-containing protein [Alphaproteobacteria bacterium]
MVDTKTEQEPSIEEILESIRQIISEDTDGDEKLVTEENPLDISQAAPPPSDVVQEPVVLAPIEQKPVPDSDFVPDPIPELVSEPDSDLVLKSTPEPVSEPDSDLVLKSAPEPVSEPDSDLVLKPASEPVSESDSDLVLKSAPEPVPDVDVDVLDLVDKVNPEQDVKSEEQMLAKVEMMEKPVTDEPMVDEKDALISVKTADIAVETLSKLLAGNIAVEETSGHTGKVTLEDMTRELMRPMIKSWIDKNLPVIIEKMVQKEIEKLSRLAMDR